MTGEGGTPSKPLEAYRDYLRLHAQLRLPVSLRGKVDPSDLVQESLLEAHQSRAEYRGQTEAEMLAWLRGILAHNIADALRRFGTEARDVARERHLGAHLEASLPDDIPLPHQQADQEEKLLLLADALARLPEDQRRAVELKHLGGNSVEFVAEEMGRSEASVAGLLRRGLSRLRELLA
jgi:RNA polymerase sigma-70 factor (ECF subfamily)